MRILVTVTPLMYRESLALALQHTRPNFEVALGLAGSLDGDSAAFQPHMLVRNDTDGVSPQEIKSMPELLCQVEILYSDSMGARITLEDTVWGIKDMCTEDLIQIADQTSDLLNSRSGRTEKTEKTGAMEATESTEATD